MSCAPSLQGEQCDGKHHDVGGKEFMEACSIHNRETALSHSTGAAVSPMTWDCGSPCRLAGGARRLAWTVAQQGPLQWSGDTGTPDDAWPELLP